MAATSVGSQKFSSLEIVDSAKFDNEIVFDTLSMIGTDLSIVVEENVTISSTNTTGIGGVNILSGLDIYLIVSSDNSTIWMLGGSEGETNVPGSVVLGYDSDTTPNSTLEVAFDGTNAALGFFGTTPSVQQNTSITPAIFTANTSGITDDSATFDGYTIGQIVASLRNYGLLT